MTDNLTFKKNMECGDATCWYNVTLSTEMTVKEFIQQIKKESGEEKNHGWFGYFTIQSKTEHTWPFLEYRAGSLYKSKYQDRAPYKEILAKYGDKKITKLTANGGWGNMSYYIWVEEE